MSTAHGVAVGNADDSCLQRLIVSGRWTDVSPSRVSMKSPKRPVVTRNHIAAFIGECIDRLPHGEVNKDDLYNCWLTWRDEHELRPCSGAQFFVRFRAMTGAVTHTLELRGHRQHLYRGVKLKTPPNRHDVAAAAGEKPLVSLHLCDVAVKDALRDYAVEAGPTCDFTPLFVLFETYRTNCQRRAGLLSIRGFEASLLKLFPALADRGRQTYRTYRTFRGRGYLGVRGPRSIIL